MWLRLLCWWYKVCYKHGRVKDYGGGVWVCTICESDKAHRRESIRDGLVKKTQQSKLEFK